MTSRFNKREELIIGLLMYYLAFLNSPLFMPNLCMFLIGLNHINAVQQDPKLQDIVKQVEFHSLSSHQSFVDGWIYFKNIIYLPKGSDLIDTIANEFHSSIHEGYHKLLKRLHEVFFWLGMKDQVRDIICSSETCQVHKASTTTPARLIQPLPIPPSFGHKSP